MKIRFLLLALAGVGMLASCSKDAANGSGVTDDASKSIVLKINLPQGTRAFNPDAPYAEGQTKLSSLDIYFANSNGTVQKYYEVTGEKFNKITSEGLRFVDLDNVTSVYVVANGEEKVGVGTRMNTFTSRLRTMAPSIDQNAVTFAGSTLDITPVILDTDDTIENYDDAADAPQEGDQVYTANITIRPLISRIEWGEIEIDSEGEKLVQSGDKYYLVKWEGWNPVLTGIYQSNVYIAEKIFDSSYNTQVPNSYLFSTPTNASNSLVNGAWKQPTAETHPDFVSITSDVWGQINGTIAYTSGVYGDTPGNLLAGYDPATQCIPFHFFVPFTAATENFAEGTEENPLLNEIPQWHFELCYPERTDYKVTVYQSDAQGSLGDEVDVNTDDDALAVAGNFYFPERGDNLAYATVTALKKTTSVGVGGSDDVYYNPGKIYTVDKITIAPYNVTPGFREVSNYNIIVKVTVADFETQEVKPEFDKDL